MLQWQVESGHRGPDAAVPGTGNPQPCQSMLSRQQPGTATVPASE
jgi:hypothetical protein